MSHLLPLSGPDADRLVFVLIALATGGLGLLLSRRRPSALAVVYVGAMFFLPIWTGVTIGVFLPPQILAGLLVLAVALPRARALGVRTSWVDLLVAAFVIASLAPLLAGAAPPGTLVFIVLQYLGAYLVGRLLPLLVGPDYFLRVLVVAVSVLAALTLVEHFTGTNVFQSFPGSPSVHAQWNDIQIRGGVARAEGAFGHSIALGATLAMCIPLVLSAPVPSWLRIGSAVLAASGVVVTFSRIGLITAVLGIVMSVVAAGDLTRRARFLLAGSITIVALVAVPLLSRVFVAAGDEASNSAAYRADLLSLVGDIDILGLSSAFDRTPTGQVRFDDFGSIDSALILQGLSYGWTALAITLLLLAIAAAAVLRRRASAGTIAIVAQIPALATVALITQYATMLWFVAGLAVWGQLALARPGVSTARTGFPSLGESANQQLRGGIAWPGRVMSGPVSGERV